MSLKFYVQLLVDNPNEQSPTTVDLPSLGCSAIRRAIAPLMSKDERGCIPSSGEFPFIPGLPAYSVVMTMRNDYSQRIVKLGEKLRQVCVGASSADEWTDLYNEYTNLKKFIGLLNTSLWAANSVAGNDNVSCRLVWC